MKPIHLVTCCAVLAALLSSSCATGTCATAPAAPPSIQRSAADGTCLESYTWANEKEARGVVVVVHGIRDHALRYEPLARSLTAAGFVVAAQDMRGHGRSGGHRQRFDSMEQLVADLEPVVEAARTANPGKPVFLYGHSLGGLIATTYATKHQGQLAGLILSGPALKLLPTVTSGELGAARFFGSVLPNLAAQPVDDSTFVTSPEAKAELAADPLVSHENLPARSAKAAIEGIDAIAASMETLTVPMLVMHASEDKATNPDGSRELVAKARSTDKTLRIWEGQNHDLLHEAVAPQVIDTTVRWIEAHAVVP